jgi:hypothetical protein
MSQSALQTNSYGCEGLQRHEFARHPVQSIIGSIALEASFHLSVTVTLSYCN